MDVRTRSFNRYGLSLTLALGYLLSNLPDVVCGEQLLRWKLTKGEALFYQFKQSTQTETAGAGKAMRVTLETAMTVSWKIDSVDAQQIAAITQSIDAFSVTMKTDKLDPVVYDSAAKTPPTGPAREIANGVAKLLGAPCRIQMTDRGEIVSVEPSEQFQQALAPVPGNAANSLLSIEGMTQVLRQAAVVLPEKPVAESSTWEIKQKLLPTSTVLLGNQYTYAGVLEKEGVRLDKIGVESSLTLDPSATGTASSLKLKEGSQSGTLWFDSARGRMVESELAQRLVTERPYRDLSIRVQSTSTVSMKLVK